MTQIGVGFEPVGLLCRDQRAQISAAFRTGHGIAEQPATSANKKRASRILDEVGVHPIVNCGGKTNTMRSNLAYDRHETEGYLGNVG